MKGWAGAMTRMRMRPPAAWAWISALGEFAGGLALAVGLFYPLPSIAVAGAMLVAIALVHLPKGFWNSKGGFEFNLSILGAVTALALTGPGVVSLDNLLGIRFPEPVTLIVLTIILLVSLAGAFVTRTPAPVAEPKPQAT